MNPFTCTVDSPTLTVWCVSHNGVTRLSGSEIPSVMWCVRINMVEEADDFILCF